MITVVSLYNIFDLSSLKATQENVRGCKVKGIGGLGVWGVEGFRSLGVWGFGLGLRGLGFGGFGFRVG